MTAAVDPHRIALVVSCWFAPAIAFADPAPSSYASPYEPLALTLGVGMTQIGDTGYGADPTTSASSSGVAFDALLAFRVTPYLGIGFRVATATATTYSAQGTCGDNLRGPCRDLSFAVTPLDLGLTVQYARGRFWIAPWIGEHVTTGSGHSNRGSLSFQTNDFIMLGITGGIDLLSVGDNKFGLYFDYHHGTGRTPIPDSPENPQSDPQFANWSAITAGVAYRR